jgi:hypothetical protein
MRTLLTLIIATFPCFACGVACGKGQQGGVRLTSSQCRAIREAERYVSEYGYTAEPPRASEADLAREPANRGLSVSAELKLRRNSLKPFAIGLVHGLPGNQDGETVIFEPNPEWLKQWPDPERQSPHSGRGVAVLVPAADAPIHIAHVDFMLDHIQVRLPTHDMVEDACAPTR